MTAISSICSRKQVRTDSREKMILISPANGQGLLGFGQDDIQNKLRGFSSQRRSAGDPYLSHLATGAGRRLRRSCPGVRGDLPHQDILLKQIFLEFWFGSPRGQRAKKNKILTRTHEEPFPHARKTFSLEIVLLGLKILFLYEIFNPGPLFVWPERGARIEEAILD